MDIKQLMELINSCDDDTTAAKKIHKLLNKQPNLASESFFLGRTLFHILVLKNKPIILEFLLKYELWREKALQGDRNNVTIMHLVARQQNDSSDLMNLLIKRVPELINVQNKTGNTPLHDAVGSEQCWAILCLVKASGINRLLKNKNNQTAYQLAGANSELKQALLHLELPIRLGANRIDRRNSLSDSSDLSGSFPILSARHSDRSLTLSSSSWDSLHSPVRFEGINIINKEYIEQVDTPLEQSIPFGELLSLFKKLSTAYHLEDHATFERLQHQFYTRRFVLDDTSCFKQAWTQIPEARAVFFKLISDLYPAVSTLHKNTEEIIHCILNDVLCALIGNKEQMTYQLVEKMAVVPLQYKDKRAEIEAVWLITLGQEDYSSGRTLNYEHIMQQTLGLLSWCTASQLMTYLQLLYAQFDSAQRAIAHYIVCHAINYEVINSQRIDLLLKQQLQAWLDLTSTSKNGGVVFHSELHGYLKQVIDEATRFTSRALLHNFSMINQMLEQATAIKENRSFDRLIDRAFSLKKDRAKEVGVIAQELRILTVSFYQKVRLGEFNDGAWLKPQAVEHASNIVLATHRFNQLSKYFVQKIVSQPAHNVKNAFQLVLEIAQALCPLDGEHYPDLNSLMLISSAINNLNIARLSSIFDHLSEREKKIVDEINKMVSTYKNSYYMRQVYESFHTTLPFLGDILSMLTAAKEGNTHPIMQMEVMGEILLQLMEIKQIVNCEPIFHETDLLTYFDSYQEPADDDLYKSSLELQPRKQSDTKRSGKRMSLKMFDRDKIKHAIELKSEHSSSSAPGANG